MGLFSADQLRAVEVETRALSTESAATNELQTERLRELGADRAATPSMRFLLIAAVQAIEFLALTLSGLAYYHFHVTPQIGPQPLYYLLTSGVALLSLIAFHSLQSYSIPALRRPVNQLFRMSGAWLGAHKDAK